MEQSLIWMEQCLILNDYGFKHEAGVTQELIGVEFSDVYLMQCLGLSAKSAEQLAQAEYGADIPYRGDPSAC